jgi:hypothetical protein
VVHPRLDIAGHRGWDGGVNRIPGPNAHMTTVAGGNSGFGHDDVVDAAFNCGITVSGV